MKDEPNVKTIELTARQVEILRDLLVVEIRLYERSMLTQRDRDVLAERKKIMALLAR
ncbi:MAG: hypothetical protein JO023_26090 [Chloroflexi bacterium]|nr:hypothetical protein [Chloroflexota bacterium]